MTSTKTKVNECEIDVEDLECLECLECLEFIEKEGFDVEDLELLEEKGYSIGDLKFIKEKGYVIEDLELLEEKRYTIGDLKFIKEKGYVIEDLELLEEKGYSIGDLKFIKEKGYAIEDLELLEKEGFCVGDLELLEELGYDVEDVFDCLIPIKIPEKKRLEFEKFYLEKVEKQHNKMQHMLTFLEKALDDIDDEKKECLAVDNVKCSFRVSDALKNSENLYLDYKKDKKQDNIEKFFQKKKKRIKNTIKDADICFNEFSELFIMYIEENTI